MEEQKALVALSSQDPAEKGADFFFMIVSIPSQAPDQLMKPALVLPQSAAAADEAQQQLLPQAAE